MTEDVDILLVEDNPSDAYLAARELRRNKLTISIYIAHDGVEALDFVLCRGPQSGRSFSQPPKLILLDLHLPGINGLAVLETIKQDARTKMIPVVILSTSIERMDLLDGYRMGANAVIEKPKDFAQFRHVIEQIANFWLGVNRLPPRQLPNPL